MGWQRPAGAAEIGAGATVTQARKQRMYAVETPWARQQWTQTALAAAEAAVAARAAGVIKALVSIKKMEAHLLVHASHLNGSSRAHSSC
eukprot:1161081-Pelagomonas_calceolata.AAC.5